MKKNNKFAKGLFFYLRQVLILSLLSGIVLNQVPFTSRSTAYHLIAPKSSFLSPFQLIILDLANKCHRLVKDENLDTRIALQLIEEEAKGEVSFLEKMLKQTGKEDITAQDYFWYADKKLNLILGIEKRRKNIVILQPDKTLRFKKEETAKAAEYLASLLDKKTKQDKALNSRITTSPLITKALSLAEKYSPHSNQESTAGLLLNLESPSIKEELIAAVILKDVPLVEIVTSLLTENYPELKRFLKLVITWKKPLKAAEKVFAKIDGPHREVKAPYMIKVLSSLTAEPATVSKNEVLEIHSLVHNHRTFYCAELLGDKRYLAPAQLDLASVFKKGQESLSEELVHLNHSPISSIFTNKFFTDNLQLGVALLNPQKFLQNYKTDARFLSDLSNYLSRIRKETSLEKNYPYIYFSLSYLYRIAQQQLALLTNIQNVSLMENPEALALYFSNKNHGANWNTVREIQSIPRPMIEEISLTEETLNLAAPKLTKTVKGFPFAVDTFDGNDTYKRYGTLYFQRLLDYRPYLKNIAKTTILDDIRDHNRRVEIHQGTHEQTLAELKQEGCVKVLQYFSPRFLGRLDRPMQYQIYVAFHKDHSVRYVFRTLLNGRPEHLLKTLFIYNVKGPQIVSKYFDIDYHQHYRENLKELLQGKKVDYFVAGTLGYVKGYFSERTAILNLTRFFHEDLAALQKMKFKESKLIKHLIDKLNFILINGENYQLPNEELWNLYKDALIKFRTLSIESDTPGLLYKVRTLFSILAAFKEKYGFKTLAQKDNLFSVKKHLEKILDVIRNSQNITLTKAQEEILHLFKKRISDSYFLEQINFITQAAQDLIFNDGYAGFKKVLNYTNFIEQLIAFFPEVKELEQYRIFGNIEFFEDRTYSSCGGEFALLHSKSQNQESKNIIVSHILYTHSMVPLIEVLTEMGVKNIVLSGSLGGFRPDYEPGDLVVTKNFFDADFRPVNEKTPNMLLGHSLPPGIKIGENQMVAESLIDEDGDFMERMKRENISLIDQEFSIGYQTVAELNAQKSPEEEIKIGTIGYVSDCLNGDDKIKVEENPLLQKVFFSETFTKRLFFIFESLGLVEVDGIKSGEFSKRLAAEIKTLKDRLSSQSASLTDIINIFGSVDGFIKSLTETGRFIDQHKDDSQFLIKTIIVISQIMRRGGILGKRPSKNFPYSIALMRTTLKLAHSILKNNFGLEALFEQGYLSYVTDKYIFQLYRTIAEENIIGLYKPEVEELINDLEIKAKLFTYISKQLGLDQKTIDKYRTILLWDLGRLADNRIFALTKQKHLLAQEELAEITSNCLRMLANEGIFFSPAIENTLSQRMGKSLDSLSQTIMEVSIAAQHFNREIAAMLSATASVEPNSTAQVSSHLQKALKKLKELWGDTLSPEIYKALAKLIQRENSKFFKIMSKIHTRKPTSSLDNRFFRYKNPFTSKEGVFKIKVNQHGIVFYEKPDKQDKTGDETAFVIPFTYNAMSNLSSYLLKTNILEKSA